MTGQFMVTYNDWENSYHVYPLGSDVHVMPEAMNQVAETPAFGLGTAYAIAFNGKNIEDALKKGYSRIHQHIRQKQN
jgi:hypothetical protein